MSYGSGLMDVVQSSTTGTPTQFNDGSGTQVGTLCRAWVNFGYVSSAITVRASFNVSSVVRNGTGDYTINLTNALIDANYAAIFTTAVGAGSSSAFVAQQNLSRTQTSSATNFLITYTGIGQLDQTYCTASIFR